ncbi:LOW QUALITY PROTEIN: hypothetical protein PHMEG_00017409 [Phytophthora megakarya]|uniref:Reverse transcriptase domain-containing protein n=1 Tax=Phytophthora megakarya TaxID=4795 RepID=A0A225VY49_9STRA|nr:LOW QUALITY PROTEIN: hypothetical protein PHMEG_00017409 [Phytophthora megakarya]
MVVIQGPQSRIRRSVRLAKTTEDADMARTKVVMKLTTTTTSDDTPDVSARAKNQTASVSLQTLETRKRRSMSQETEIAQEDSDADDENDAPRQTRDRANRGDGATEDGATAMSMAELTAALTQMATLMTRMGDRINDLGTAHHYRQATTADTAATATTTGTAPPATSASTQRTTTTEATRQDTPAAGLSATQRPQRGSGSGDGDDGDGDDSSSSSSESADDDVRQVGVRQPATAPADRDAQRSRRRTIRDLDLPTFLPTPQTSLALTGARLSGRGEWSDAELYYVLSPKLQESAARWWVQLDRKLRDRDRTWATLRTALTNRYGERPNKSMAEWCVGQRCMIPGETYADFVASLRDLCGNNRFTERVLLEKFYRSIYRTTRALVKQHRPKIRTVEEAVEKATEISDPIYNVAQGMEKIGQAFVTAPDPYVVSVSGTTGHMAMIPGVGSAVIAEEEKLTLFTNPRGVYNKFTGLYVAPRRRTWNGTVWAPPARKRPAPAAATTPAAKRVAVTKFADQKAKVTMEVTADDVLAAEDDDSGADVSYAQPVKKQKTVAKRQKADTRLTKGVEVPREKPYQKPPSRDWSDSKSYACYQLEHIAPTRRLVPAMKPTSRGVTRRGSRKTRNERHGMKMSSNDGSVAAIRAVTAHLKQELESRDSERAKRYVSTMRSAMAELRYEYRDGEDGGTRPRDEGAEMNVASEVPMTAECVMATQMAIQEQSTVVVTSEEAADAVATPEEGGGEVRLTEEGASSAGTADTDVSKVVDELAAMELGIELTDIAMMKIGGVAKKSKRGEKQQRAREKVEKQSRDAAEMSRVVAELAQERDTRRQRQAVEVRKALVVRRKLRADDERVRVNEKARVNLVRHEGTVTSTETNKSTDVNVEASDGLPTAAMLVEGVTQRVKIDSGARYCVAGTDWIARGERKRVDAPVAYVEGIGGFLLNVLGVWTFDMVNVYGQKYQLMRALWTNVRTSFLLVLTAYFLEKYRATVDFDRSEVRYDEKGHEVIIPFRTTKDGSDSTVAAVRRARATNLPRRSVQTVDVAVAAPDGEIGVFVPTVNNGAVMLAPAMTKVKNGRAAIPAIYTYGGRVKLPNKRELGVWAPLKQDIELLEMSGELQPEKVRVWLDELGDVNMPLTDESVLDIGTQDGGSRALILKLLRAYRDLDNAQTECAPATTLKVDHRIETGDTAPIMMRRRRQAHTEDAVVDSNVDSMLSADGAWGFPVVLVKKKDGSVRFCVDYRSLNAVTRKDIYPLPRIDETLGSLGGAQLFFTLDLRSENWQIRVAEEDRDKSAFTTKRGLYRFKRMPFGLCNAPVTFQRLMKGVLRGLTWLTCLVYLDDIIISTQGGEARHVVELACVFERLREAGSSLKLKKCTFLTNSMEYLGHHLSDQGVQPAERLVKSVREFPRPADAHEVKRFVHLAGYYRKFIAAFASDKTPEEGHRVGTEAQEFAFERVKMLLTPRRLLLYPNFKLLFRLVTDASKIGLGACLMQDHGHG